MSILIDDLISVYSNYSAKRRCSRGLVIAKNIDFCGWRTIWMQIRDAFYVLIGKCRAYHFYEDFNEVD